ncbi:MAG: type II secretion system minor pseudopilin GspI [Gammaproteobacteria bacterium]
MRFDIRRELTGGFTLIETVVALLIVSLGMTALFMQLSRNTASGIYLRDKALASWIASNVLTELSLQENWPEVGAREGEVQYARQEWTYRIQVSATEVQNLRRAEVSIAHLETPNQTIHVATALIEPPTPPGIAPLQWESVGGFGDYGGQRN